MARLGPFIDRCSMLPDVATTSAIPAPAPSHTSRAQIAPASESQSKTSASIQCVGSLSALRSATLPGVLVSSGPLVSPAATNSVRVPLASLPICGSADPEVEVVSSLSLDQVLEKKRNNAIAKGNLIDLTDTE